MAPLRLGGLRGKKSTPSIWLGGTGELVAVGKLGAGAAWRRSGTERSAGTSRRATRQRYDLFTLVESEALGFSMVLEYCICLEVMAACICSSENKNCHGCN